MAFSPLDTPIDYVLINGQRSPGLATIEQASLPERWDERNGYGISGSYSAYLGRKLARPVLTLRLYTAEHWAAWHTWREVLARPPRGRRPKALEIWHPWLEELDIKSVGVEDHGQWTPIDNGGFAKSIQLIEWRVPKLTLAKPEAAAAPQKSQDPVDQQIELLASQVSKLAAG